MSSHSSVPHFDGLVGEEAANPKSESKPKSNPRFNVALAGALRRLRTQRGLSLERFARQSGVSRAMLGQIELGRSTPSVAVLWKISNALDVSLASLLNAGMPRVHVLQSNHAHCIRGPSGRSSFRILSSVLESSRVSFYELKLEGIALEVAETQPEGTRENIVVNSGVLTLNICDKYYHLSAGDSLCFDADVPHTYENPGSVECRAYLVRSFPANI
jgi:transcriptional regulator with XRE-family HTH domain